MNSIISLLCFISLFGLKTTAEFPKNIVSERTAAWENSYDDKRLTQCVIIRLKSTSTSECALKCLKIPQCRSFNFCTSRLCELNSDDVISIGRNQSWMMSHAGCTYHGMQKDHAPRCFHWGKEQDILDDQNPGTQFSRIEILEKFKSFR